MYNTGRRLSVLVVNQYYPPDTSATAGIFADLTSAFADAGHEVAVLCGRPSYRPRERRSWRPLRIESGANGEVVERVGSAALEMRSLRMRGANYASFLGLASVRAAFRPRADVVVAGTDPPLAVIVALLAARSSTTFRISTRRRPSQPDGSPPGASRLCGSVFTPGR